MKRFDILLLCFVINNVIVIFAKTEEVTDSHFASYEDELSYNFSQSGEVDIFQRSHADSKEIHEALEKVLKVSVKLSNESSFVGAVYETEKKQLLLVKESSKPEYVKKYYGEYEGLKALRNTKTVYLPRPIAVGHTSNKSQHFIALEFLNITILDDETMAELGGQIADMHMCNWKHKCGNKPSIKKFGFHVDTSIGIVPLNNTWNKDWITFFIENRMTYQIKAMMEKNEKEWLMKKVLDYWPRLKPLIPKFFEGIEVKPSLLHGDLYSRNTAEHNLKPVIYDPAAFYGHHEYDISTTILFEGFSDTFYDAYFKKIPKAKGFEKRMLLYHLYDYLNHWVNLGCGYLDLAVETFEKILNEPK